MLLEKNEFNINLAMPLTISKSKLKHFRKIEELDLKLMKTSIGIIWKLVLVQDYWKNDTKPVHTLKITGLKENFPNNIKQFFSVL